MIKFNAVSQALIVCLLPALCACSMLPEHSTQVNAVYALHTQAFSLLASRSEKVGTTPPSSIRRAYDAEGVRIFTEASIDLSDIEIQRLAYAAKSGIALAKSVIPNDFDIDLKLVVVNENTRHAFSHVSLRSSGHFTLQLLLTRHRDLADPSTPDVIIPKILHGDIYTRSQVISFVAHESLHVFQQALSITDPRELSGEFEAHALSICAPARVLGETFSHNADFGTEDETALRGLLDNSDFSRFLVAREISTATGKDILQETDTARWQIFRDICRRMLGVDLWQVALPPELPGPAP